MVDHAIKTFGRLDYAVNNAGIEGRFSAITELAEDDWDQVLNINLKGTFLGMQHQARAMLAAGNGGAIVKEPLNDSARAAYRKYKHPIRRIPEVSRTAPMPRLIPVAVHSGPDFAQFCPVAAIRTAKASDFAGFGLSGHERCWTARARGAA